MTTKNLLVELVVEELPPKALLKLGQSFGRTLFEGLQSNDFLEDGAALSVFATPRRLAAHITRVRSVSLPRERVTKLMPKSIGLDAENKPTAALQKKIKSLYHGGVDVEAILAERVTVEGDGKAEVLVHRELAAGSPLAIRLEGAIDDAIEALPVPKVMSYQLSGGKTVHFVRPAHRLLALHGSEVVEGMSVLGLPSQRATLGHRFLCALPGAAFDIPHADAYADTLKEQGKVIPSFEERRDAIRAALLAKAGDDRVLMPETLLDEVTALVEWPAVYECRFEETFLSVPQECLILTMQTNQKYFALTDAQGKLRPRFLIVSNIETPDPAQIIQGNERVVRPRLSDAQFFFEQDKKKPLASRVPQLANVVYHNKLGNQLERTQRVAALAGTIACMMGADAALAQRAATLAKADLLTDMVGEFPELQGIMGTYYARHDGEPDDVARAASEHYQPRFAGDALPETSTGTVVALADKLETLVGIWGIGLQPTGDKDPFALRRHALGVLRMLLEKRQPLSLRSLLNEAASRFAGNPAFQDPTNDVLAFLFDRLRGLLRERGYAVSAVEAVIAQQPDTLDNLVERLDAVRAFAALPEAEALAAANKRITNILKKTDAVAGSVDAALLRETGEQRLHAALAAVHPEVDRAYAAGDFTGALKTMARLRDDVDAFFNDVMVMAEDEALRRNRLALLSQLHGMLNRVADISKLAA